MTIEFYGEISEYTKRRADKLKKRYFAVWMMGIAVALFVVTAISAMFQQTFWVILIFAVLIGGVGCFLYMSPMKKAVKEVWKARIVIDGETIFWTQYLPGRRFRRRPPGRRLSCFALRPAPPPSIAPAAAWPLLVHCQRGRRCAILKDRNDAEKKVPP